MKFSTWISVCLISFFSPAADSSGNGRSKIDVQDVVSKILSSQPEDPEIMFVNMVFGRLDKEYLFDVVALQEIYRQLEKLNDRKFERRFGADPRYRRWLMASIREMWLYCESKDADIRQLATKMDTSGHLIVGALNNTNNNQLLYLIRYLATKPGMKLREMENGRWITAGQLMVVMQFEQDQRNAQSKSRE